ncbi:hypothetical protein [Xylanimonas ulmi]|nr:hypothetical protein [Xylanibacterium ulmi]
MDDSGYGRRIRRAALAALDDDLTRLCDEPDAAEVEEVRALLA